MALPNISGFIGSNPFGDPSTAVVQDAENEVLNLGLNSELSSAALHADAANRMAELRAKNLEAQYDAQSHATNMGNITRFAGAAFGGLGSMMGGAGGGLEKLGSHAGPQGPKSFGSMPHSFGGAHGGVGP